MNPSNYGFACRKSWRKGLLFGLLVLLFIAINACSHYQQSIINTNTINQTNAPNLKQQPTAIPKLLNNPTNFSWSATKSEKTNLIISTSKNINIFPFPNFSEDITFSATNPTSFTTNYDNEIIGWIDDTKTVSIRRLQEGSEEKELASIISDQTLVSLALSNSGNKAAYSSINPEIIILEIDNGQQKKWPLTSWVTNLEFSHDDKMIGATDLQNQIFYIFDVVTGAELLKLSRSENVNSVLYTTSLSPKWTKLAWVARNTIFIMSVPSGEAGPSLVHEDYVNAMAWSPDGQLIASAAGGTIDDYYQSLVYIWDSDSGQLLAKLPQNDPIQQLSFSPDGKELGVLTSTGNFEIWQPLE